jgi:tripartite-type tricarboxylate transporter receptor subunit TctC
MASNRASRLTIRWAILAALAWCAVPRAAYAQADAAYPTKPVRFISAAVPGAGSDTTTRAIAHRLTQTWGQQVIVDNRPGAAGLIALDVLAKALPDGHTLVLVSANVPLNTAINAGWPYDLNKDTQPLSQVTSLFYIAYHHPAVPVTTFKDLIAHGRAQPGKLYFSSAGAGSLQHLGWELIMQMSGAKFTHVPYKSGAPAITATIGGETQFGFGTLISLRPHMLSGRIRVTAVTSKQRAPTLPDVPTIAESGWPGYEIDQWYGVVTGVKVPAAIVNKLNASIVAAVKSPEVAQRLAADGSTAVGSSAAQFSAMINAETAKWRKVAKETGLMLN